MKQMNAEELIQYIQMSHKKTPVKVYIKGNLSKIDFGPEIQTFTNEKTGTLFGEWSQMKVLFERYREEIEDFVVENDMRNSAIPLLDLKEIEARIEPGAIIRDQVEIGKNVIVMMGATINIGAVIGDGTMIDMNTVIGGRAIIGTHCHIGAGAVIAGVIEPPSAKPVTIEDHVMIGANAVILEGVRVGQGSVVAAGAIVINDVPAGTVVAGTPAKVLKKIDEKTKGKTEIKQELRQL